MQNQLDYVHLDWHSSFVDYQIDTYLEKIVTNHETSAISGHFELNVVYPISPFQLI